MAHPNAGVQIEAAWAAAKLEHEHGLRRLVDYCGDLKHAHTAKRYLSELGREDLIPAAANEPGFEALAEFAQWLVQGRLKSSPANFFVASMPSLPPLAVMHDSTRFH